MKTVTYHAYASPLASLANKAARAWNRALKCEALRVGGAVFATNIRIRIELDKVDRSHDYERVAQFRGVPGNGIITLADDVKWSVTFWQRFFGTGTEDALAALLHEFGHALGLPHSDRESDVMAPVLGSTVISSDEAARYRRFLQL